MPTLTEQAVAEYFAAIRAMDVERRVAVFAPDAEQQDPVGTPPNLGHEAIRAFFIRMFSGFKAVSLSEDGVWANGNSAAVKLKAKAIAHSGKTVEFEGIDLIDCNQAGKIAMIRAFWDPAPVMALLQS